MLSIRIMDNQSSTADYFLVTGCAGFIGYHLSRALLKNGHHVIGVDNLSDYYDVNLKNARLDLLRENTRFEFINASIEHGGVMDEIFSRRKFKGVVHLAAQAGVRYSIENPRSYLESNIIGTFELLEAARKYPPDHLLIASTSSAYGANDKYPYRESDKSDHQVSFYAATKKSCEVMCHSYSHLFGLPITMFRFFTVYGPWGRPDMALFKFTKNMLEGKEIDVYNMGNLSRDFTYVDDLVAAILKLSQLPPKLSADTRHFDDSLSPVAPYRMVNIGNSAPVQLMDFIAAIEQELGVEAKINFLPMQAGDVVSTFADTSLLEKLTGFAPRTDIKTGVSNFVSWYRSYYMKNSNV